MVGKSILFGGLSKSLAEFYPQGVRGIREAAEPPTAAQAARRRQIILIVFCRDMCVAENTLRGVSVELSAFSGQPRHRTQRTLLGKVDLPLFRHS